MNLMSVIQILDKKFEPYISYNEIELAIDKMAKKINDELKDDLPVFLMILNGSFMFGADLMKRIDFPCEVSFVKVASYAGTKSTEEVKELIGLNEDLKGRNVVIVEDIIDSGLTIDGILKDLKNKGVKSVKISTLLLKPKAFKGSYDIDYVGMEIPNDFIVGYGLDYNQLGRNLKDIYKIVE